jgi:glycerol kinase
VVAWDKSSGEALGKAIVWQDRRTDSFCQKLKADGHEPMVQAKTGLLLDPYFSGSKISWMLKNRPELATVGDNLAFGTIESWLIFKLTGNLHVSDASNASRTMLMALDGMDWDAEMLALLGIGRAALPRIVDCAGDLGKTLPELFGAPIAITGSIGDQQSATIGQGCLRPGETKATFGTGAFILTNSGESPPHSSNRMLTTVLSQIDGKRQYALEGSIFVAGSLMQWLRDEIGILATAGESEALARSVEDNAGVYLVPALSGLGAPHWRADVTATISGMSFATKRAHIVRAALESMAHQCSDLKSAFAQDGVDWQTLRVDGGMVVNDWMVQDLADMLAIPVERPAFVETTALGAAMMSGVGAGLFADLEQASAAMRSSIQTFAPQMPSAIRKARQDGWRDALHKVLAR